MTTHETAIAERLRAAADRIDVDVDPSRLTDAGPTTDVGRLRAARRRRAIAGLAVAASIAAVVAALALVPDGGGTVHTDRSDTGASNAAPSDTAPSDTDRSDTAPSDTTTPAVDADIAYAAQVESPPDWFGEPVGAYRDAGFRTGRWVSTAIGRVGVDTIAEPIVVSVFDGRYVLLDGAQRVTIGGTPLRSVREGEWQALATDGTPTVVVSGAVDDRTLVAVLDAVEVTDPTGDFSLRLRNLPEGYAEVVSPRVLGPDPPTRPTLASSESNHVGIDEISDWTDPVLAAAGSGAEITAVGLDAHGTVGWTGRATFHEYGPLRFLMWSPRPGVVFQITTDDMDRSVDDLVELAEATSAVRIDEWERIYDP